MKSKTKNILIFCVVGLVLVLAYFFFIKKEPTDNALITSSNPIPNTQTITEGDASAIEKDFVSLLLSVKSIKLEDKIFSNIAFFSLKDSSIVLIQEGNEGRINPFAPIGEESISATTPIEVVPTDITSTNATSTNTETSVSTE